MRLRSGNPYSYARTLPGLPFIASECKTVLMKSYQRKLFARGAVAIACASLVAGLSACSRSARGACVAAPAAGSVGTLCGVRNPEDVEIVASADLILISSMRHEPGGAGGAILAASLSEAAQGRSVLRRLWPPETAPPAREQGGQLYGDSASGDPACRQAPNPQTFSPHGLRAMRGAHEGLMRVAVVAHNQREAVELFDLVGEGDEARMYWSGCILMPPGTVANDVDFRGDGSLIVSNYQPTMSGVAALAYMLKSQLGFNTGDLLHWSPGRGWRHIPGTEARNPNGVLVSADDRNVFYAETGSGKITRASIEGAEPAAGFPSVDIGGNPDNLSWGRDGKLLAPTHAPGIGVMSCMLGARPCRAGWSLFEIDPYSLQATKIFEHDGSRIGGVSSAAYYEGTYYFGAIFDDRIGFLRLSSSGR